jgi:hypothetical protein
MLILGAILPIALGGLAPARGDMLKLGAIGAAMDSLDLVGAALICLRGETELLLTTGAEGALKVEVVVAMGFDLADRVCVLRDSTEVVSTARFAGVLEGRGGAPPGGGGGGTP